MLATTFRWWFVSHFGIPARFSVLAGVSASARGFQPTTIVTPDSIGDKRAEAG